MYELENVAFNSGDKVTLGHNVATPRNVEIVKMSKAIVKTAEMLAEFSAQEDAVLVSATLAFVESENEAEDAVASFASVVGAKPTFERYEMARIRFVETLQGAGLSDDAIRQRSSRFFRKLGIDKPKSASKSATKKADQRAKAREVFASKTDAELATEIKTLVANPTVESLAHAYKIEKELDQRKRDYAKADKGEKAFYVEKLRDWIKTAELSTMRALCENLGLI